MCSLSMIVLSDMWAAAWTIHTAQFFINRRTQTDIIV